MTLTPMQQKAVRLEAIFFKITGRAMPAAMLADVLNCSRAGAQALMEHGAQYYRPSKDDLRWQKEMEKADRVPTGGNAV
jgi:hypothetical protein